VHAHHLQHRRVLWVGSKGALEQSSPRRQVTPLLYFQNGLRKQVGHVPGRLLQSMLQQAPGSIKAPAFDFYGGGQGDEVPVL